ncbi:MAG: hypothetical protein SF053_02100 [Bacteroidia bacterium]|nr:hypothetical protein [Bacteroidia bacterium]
MESPLGGVQMSSGHLGGVLYVSDTSYMTLPHWLSPLVNEGHIVQHIHPGSRSAFVQALITIHPQVVILDASRQGLASLCGRLLPETSVFIANFLQIPVADQVVCFAQPSQLIGRVLDTLLLSGSQTLSETRQRVLRHIRHCIAELTQIILYFDRPYQHESQMSSMAKRELQEALQQLRRLEANITLSTFLPNVSV